MAGQTVLNLDTLIDRPVVIISGEEYRLWSTDILPPLDNHRVQRLIKRVDAISLKEEPTDAELEELAGPVVKKNGKPQTDADGNEIRRSELGLFSKITRIVLDAPDDIHKALTDKQRAEIIRTFLTPPQLLEVFAKVLAAAQATPTAVPPTGETSPGGSPGTTT
jgi:hypothetical protein